jgi:L-fuconolactonase
MPDFPIVDAHVHFWDSGINPVSWTKGLPAIDRPFMPADLDADRGAVEVEAIVFVEANTDAGLHLKEAAWVAQLAEADARIQAIVAEAPLEHGAGVAADLEKLASQAIVRGIRRLIQGRDAANLCASPAFRDGVRLLPRFGLHFEICMLHHQFQPVLDLVAACPDVHFVLDHIAKPGIAAGLREPWWQEIAQLAAFPNVDCKVSGVATEADHAAWTEAELRPYLDRVFEVFGPERVLFGSDWPVMRLAIAYPRWVGIVDAAVAGWSDADRRRLYVDNAKRIYRL